MSIALAYGIGGALAAAGIVLSFLYTGSALATTAIGTLIPILRDEDELRTRFGTFLLAAGAIGEFGPILLLTLVLSTQDAINRAVPLLAVHRARDRHRPDLRAHRAGGVERARAVDRGEQPARRAARGAARVRPRRPGRPAWARRRPRRLRRRDDHPDGGPRPRGLGARVKALGGRLRTADPVLLHRQRHQLQPRRARHEPRGDAEAADVPRAVPRRSRASRRSCSTGARCRALATGTRSPPIRRRPCRSSSRSPRSRSRTATCVPRRRQRWSGPRSSRRSSSRSSAGCCGWIASKPRRSRRRLSNRRPARRNGRSPAAHPLLTRSYGTQRSPAGVTTSSWV